MRFSHQNTQDTFQSPESLHFSSFSIEADCGFAKNCHKPSFCDAKRGLPPTAQSQGEIGISYTPEGIDFPKAKGGDTFHISEPIPNPPLLPLLAKTAKSATRGDDRQFWTTLGIAQHELRPSRADGHPL
jgi:hypothetical protein